MCVGFIDFIVEPTFSILIDATEKVMLPLIDEERLARESGLRRSRYTDISSSHQNQMDRLKCSPLFNLSAI